eukprot:Plantae.Rhodophyta-Hildenbrandia_rubra.ctg34095.p1 GENE.Plantae.Rhodophyta-Hildenbrandia_rubra.ctg34095~~Plantae.Rhodophyta-Hildenbrandia_rubra.ctg34095.p1  ORF type:complete len:306 (-),score=89.48 Plantae.Rhodophyta-Hildenbrandia_rubra.ctg34095:1279-2196(-)
MSVADAASVRTIAVQLRSLSSDVENQPIIAREDGCIKALTGFVNGEDLQVCAIAVAAVKNLASHPDNFETLRAEEELIDGLKALIIDDDVDDDLRRIAFDVVYELSDENSEEEMNEIDEFEIKLGIREENGVVVDEDPDLLKEAVTIRLRVPGISEEVLCMRVEQLLIRKKGVVSVCFERGAEIAVVYSRAPAEELSGFVAKMTGVEVEVLPEEQESDLEDELDAEEDVGKENSGGQPTYLDEAGERFRDVARKKGKKKNTISQGASSLSERLEAQRQEASRKKARANRLMSSIGRGFQSGWGFW